MGLFDELKEHLIPKNENLTSDGFRIPDNSKIIVLDPGVRRASCPTCKQLVTLNDRITSWECHGITFMLAPTL